MPNIVYVMQAGEFCKIGYTANLDSRLSGIQNGNPYKVRVIATRETQTPKQDERYLHQKFKQYRVRGEWFALPDEILRDTSWIDEIPGSHKPTQRKPVKKSRSHDRSDRPNKSVLRCSLAEYLYHSLRLRAALSGTTPTIIANLMLIGKIEEAQSEIDRQVDHYANAKGIDRAEAIERLLADDDDG